jgi:hypothetical protein
MFNRTHRRCPDDRWDRGGDRAPVPGLRDGDNTSDNREPLSLSRTVNSPFTRHNDSAPDTVTAEPPEPDGSPRMDAPEDSVAPPFGGSNPAFAQMFTC